MKWDPRSYKHISKFLDEWISILPSIVFDYILDALILPKLVDSVRKWDPLTDTLPIHIWILPWNDIMGNKMEDKIYPQIRLKLGNALVKWEPSDRSARAMLLPWKHAFNQGEMNSFLLIHIVPKLQNVLNELIINPIHQDFGEYRFILECFNT